MHIRNWRFLLTTILFYFLILVGIWIGARLFQEVSIQGLAMLVLLLYLGTALNRARRVVAPPRFPLMRTDPDTLNLPPFEEVEFTALDGVILSGWYIEPQEKPTILLVHSLGGNRVQMRFYAQALIGAGYGVLLFDLRAHARSGGQMSAFGWIEARDVLGAVEFLRDKTRSMKPDLGIIGFSLGAQIAIRAAAQSSELKAIWVDGPIPIVMEDHFSSNNPSIRELLFRPWWWLAYQLQAWISQTRPPEPLSTILPRLSPKPLMIVASGSDRLIDLARAYFDSAGEPKSFWQLDEVPFGSAVLEKGDEYGEKLQNFFNQALDSDREIRLNQFFFGQRIIRAKWVRTKKRSEEYPTFF